MTQRDDPQHLRAASDCVGCTVMGGMHTAVQARQRAAAAAACTSTGTGNGGPRAAATRSASRVCSTLLLQASHAAP
jgi:hypothetical protein